MEHTAEANIPQAREALIDAIAAHVMADGDGLAPRFGSGT
ncbi:hypothetical protein SAMN05443999_10449 [Roseovarius azorensis]|uniref:Uncharacterized protein n=1 Tax=Roseovarius azorensis TaxID=1287727 RepID=A0A1H7N8E2_9RHOB|nr:hypothetical protein SAMN05443999_10449 [Roseovarius azorensis]